MTKFAIVMYAVFFASAANATFGSVGHGKSTLFSTVANRVLDIKDQEIKIMQDAFVGLETYLRQMMTAPMNEILSGLTANIALVNPTTENKFTLDDLKDMEDKLKATIKSAGDIDISDCMKSIEQEDKPNVPVVPSAVPSSSSCDLNQLLTGGELFTIVTDIINKAITDLQQHRYEIANCRNTAIGAITAGTCGAVPVVKAVATSLAAKKSLIIPSMNLNLWWWNSGKKAVDSCKVNQRRAKLSVAAPSSTPIDPYAQVTKCVQDKITASLTVAAPIFNF